MKAQRIRFHAPYAVSLETIDLAPIADRQVLVQGICSAISPGSEKLIYRGNFPLDQAIDLNFNDQKNLFSYPLTYGYCFVGRIIETGSKVDPKLTGQQVFAFKPHQNLQLCELDELIFLPEDTDPFDACFLANLETAANLLLDCRPLLGERLAVIGQGIVGLLTQLLLQSFPLEKLLLIDTIPQRLELAASLGGATAVHPKQLAEYRHSCDAVIELSGHLQGLESAIELARYDGRIIAGSWYGESSAPFALNTHFHRMRLQIISSQVSTISPELRGRFDSKRRLSIAMNELKKIKPARFISQRLPFTEENIRLAYQQLSESNSTQLQIVFCYD